MQERVSLTDWLVNEFAAGLVGATVDQVRAQIGRAATALQHVRAATGPAEKALERIRRGAAAGLLRLPRRRQRRVGALLICYNSANSSSSDDPVHHSVLELDAAGSPAIP